ncbi:MAG: hypothetical protein NVV74_11145 [Magnetospirillum sp.]|nr:hypothetical protein [Magnetospirillum sp.]
MTDTIHHLPGRLRIRMEVLRRNPVAIARVRTLLVGKCGVFQVDANDLTGSVLVHYDTQATSGRAILDTLAAAGFAPPREHAQPADRLAQAAVSLAMDHLLGRGTSLLLAAII